MMTMTTPNDDHDCIHKEDIEDIHYIRTDLRDIKEALNIKGLTNGQIKKRVESIGKRSEEEDKRLWVKIDDLKGLIITFMIAIITIVGTFMAVITFLLVYLK